MTTATRSRRRSLGVTANGEPIPDEVKAAIRFQAQRLVEFAGKLAA